MATIEFNSSKNNGKFIVSGIDLTGKKYAFKSMAFAEQLVAADRELKEAEAKVKNLKSAATIIYPDDDDCSLPRELR